MTGRALYIGGFCMPDGNAAAQRVLSIAKLLRLSGISDIRFVGLKRDTPGVDEGDVDGFTYANYPYPTSASQWLKYLTGHDAAIAEIDQWKPDMVILYNHPAFAIERIARECHRRGIKVLADITEWYEPDGNPLFKAIKGYDTGRRMKHSHMLLDGLICISSYLAEYYRSKGVRLIELPPLVDVEQAKWHQAAIAVADPDYVKIVYAGSPGRSKDRLDLILKVMDEILLNYPNRKVKFDVIGITQEQYAATWLDHRERSYVEFHGRMPHEQVVRTLLGADFQMFLRPDNLPNRAGFPTKFVETITSRTLPVTNMSSNLSTYLHDGVNGFVIDGTDAPSIAATLRKIMDCPKEKIERMKESLDADLFDYRRYQQQFNRFIESV